MSSATPSPANATPDPFQSTAFGAADAPAADPARRALPVGFTGTAGGYFGVWIVNLLLTLLTLGIWSAWAKVRSKRWFYGHTWLDGHAFDYHATGWRILKGRLLALLLIILLSVPGAFYPPAQLLVMLLLFFVLPWALNAGLRFNARMSSWRNVRYDFHGNYWRAFGLFILLPFAVLLSLGLLAPVASRLSARYLIGGHRYGGAGMRTEPSLKRLYGAFGVAALLFVGVVAAVVMLSGGPALFAGLATLPAAEDEGSPEAVMLWLLPLVLSFYLALFVAAVYYQARLRNETLNTMAIDGGHGMRSTLSPWRQLWIFGSNAVAVVLSLSLAYPWARVRYHRYLCQNTALLARGDLDHFVTEQRRAPSSFGGEFAEMEGFAGGIGL